MAVEGPLSKGTPFSMQPYSNNHLGFLNEFLKGSIRLRLLTHPFWPQLQLRNDRVEKAQLRGEHLADENHPFPEIPGEGVAEIVEGQVREISTNPLLLLIFDWLLTIIKTELIGSPSNPKSVKAPSIVLFFYSH